MTMVPLRLGFVPLTDAAPLVVAAEIGFAGEEGLRFELIRAGSWAMLRDLLATGTVDAAHMLAVMPVAQALGLGPALSPLSVMMVLSQGGQVIGVGAGLGARMRRDAGHGFDFDDPAAVGHALHRMVGNGRIRVGVPFRFSTHTLLLRHWLRAAGMDAAQVDILTVPPPRMAEALAGGEIDAFCVGEPWGSLAVDGGAGWLLLPGRAIWATPPEKVLAARTDWAAGQPGLTGRLMRAVWRAGRWLDRPDNRGTAAELLARPEYLNLPVELVERALHGRLVVTPQGETRIRNDFVTFHDHAAAFPWRSIGALFGRSLAIDAGLDPMAAMRAGASVYRTDLFRQHLRDAGADLPGASARVEGAMTHLTAVASERGRMILAPDRFFDGWTFDPPPGTC
jgi:NitT/TauT family transport system ATP-binding protein